MSELAEGSAFHLRKTFIYFCKECAGKLASHYFLENFYEPFLKMSDDKVPSVRLEFSKALLDIKPYVDDEQERDFAIMDIMERLKDDIDQDVVDVTENTEAYLLNSHKVLKAKFSKIQQKCNDYESTLTARWSKEEEERKKKAEEEEENKLEFTSYLLESKKPAIRRGPKLGAKGKSGINSTGQGKAGGVGSRKA